MLRAGPVCPRFREGSVNVGDGTPVRPGTANIALKTVGLQAVAELLFQTMPVSLAQLQLGAIGEEHVEFAMRAGRQLPDALEIH